MAIKALCLFFVVLSCLSAKPKAEVPQALQYLGRGYNVITGDPHIINDRDPGWKSPILEPSWLKDDWVSDDGRCTYDAVDQQITGAKSAQESMKTEWNLETSVGLFGIVQSAFTASGSVQQMNNASFEYKQTFFETKAACHLKTAELPGAPSPFTKYTFTEDFQATVKAIPSGGSSSSVQWVMKKILAEKYGTHYTAKIASGGSMGIRSWMSQSSKETLEHTAKEKGFSLDVAAKSSFLFFADPSGSGGYKQNQEATKAFQEATQSGGTSTFCIGCDQFVKDDAVKWAQDLKNNLEPIGSKNNILVPISELLIPLHFPDIDAEVLKKKKATVERALQELCSFYANQGCTTSPKDRHDIPEIQPRTIYTGSMVASVQWSPNCATLVSGTDDGLVRLWEATSGSSLRILKGHATWFKGKFSWVKSVAFSPNGSLIVSGSDDTSLKIWDTATGECLQTLTGHTDSVKSVAFSPGGKHIVSGSVDHSLKIWDAAGGECLQTFTGHTDSVTAVAISPDGKDIVSGSWDKSLKIWDAATGECLQTLIGHTKYVNAVAFSPDGNHIVSGSDDNYVMIWEAATGERLQLLTSKDVYFGATSVAFSPDGKHIVSGSESRFLNIWDAATGECLQTLRGHIYGVESVAFSPDGKRIASGSVDQSIRIWDASTSRAQPHLNNKSVHSNRKEVFV